MRKSRPHRRSCAVSLPLSTAPTTWPSFQWGQLFAATLDFAPTLIVELGRHRGNSTCVFTTAAQALGARVVSLCLSERWRTETRPRIGHLVPPSWLSHLEAREEDIAAADFDAIVGDAARVLILWDAHGYHIAEHVLGRLLPAVADRPHLVLAHDVSDVRYECRRRRGRPASATACGAGTTGPARASASDISTAASSRRSPMVDFTSRNGVDAAHRRRGHPRRHRLRTLSASRRWSGCSTTCGRRRRTGSTSR